MNTHVVPPPGKLNADEFWEFIKDRPREERWQRIDGEPFVVILPNSLRHQRIAGNLMRVLDKALTQHRPRLQVLYAIGLKCNETWDFRLVADVSVIGLDGDDEFYADNVHLVAEVLAHDSSCEHISRKRELYSKAPQCLYVLIISQRDYVVEVWSRADDWKGGVYRSPDDRIELPEFGFSCCVADLYRGVKMT